MTLRIAILLALAACAPNGVTSDAGNSPGSIVGVVRVVGSAPVNVRVVLQRGEGGSYELIGSLREELMSLAGAEVAVRGEESAPQDPLTAGRIQVSEYRIVSIDGEPAVTGTIVEIEGGRARLRTESGEEIMLTSFPAEFRVGQKVWIQGPTTMAVQSYGVLRR